MDQMTYFGYQEGFDPKLFPLGSLVFQYENPTQHRPYMHQQAEGLETQRTYFDQQPVCVLRYTTHRKTSYSASLQQLVGFCRSESDNENQIVIGTKGTTVQLTNPGEFLESVVLKSDPARFWLKLRLTVAHELASKVGRIPKIWLLTAHYLITDALTLKMSSSSSSSNLSANVLGPDPTSIAVLAGLTVGVSIKFDSDCTYTAKSQTLGSKVWAAKWQRVDTKVVALKKENGEDFSTSLKLLDIVNVGRQRASDEIDVANVELAAIEEDEDDAGMPAEYWVDFDKMLNDLADQFLEFKELLSSK